jgi:hypothetical protein
VRDMQRDMAMETTIKGLTPQQIPRPHWSRRTESASPCGIQGLYGRASSTWSCTTSKWC